MRVSQYVTGRGESHGYNFSLASDSSFAVTDWMRDSTRASKIRNTGVVELQANPNGNGLEPSDFVLCYSEHVWHSIVEKDGKLVTVPVREYDYSHYLVVSANYQQQDGVSPDDTAAMAVKLLCAGQFLDLYQYQRVSGEKVDIPFTSFEISTEELDRAYDAYRERAALPVVFTGANLAVFLARYWEHCWARFANDPDARPMVLVVTSPERNNPDMDGYDIANVLIDGIVFFSQYVLPNLPSAARQITSVSFGSVVEQPNAQRGTACMVCYPTTSALSANAVFCSFENEIPDRSIDEHDKRLGMAMLNHAMPASYVRLCTLPKSEILAKNYDFARLLVIYETLLDKFAESELKKSIVIGYRGLGQMQDILRAGGVKDEHAKTYVLYPLEYGYIRACLQNAVPYDEAVYRSWLESAQTLESRCAMLNAAEREQLKTAYTALLQKPFPDLTLDKSPLDVLAERDDEALNDIEGGLLRNNRLTWEGGMASPEKLSVLIERLLHLRAIQRDDTADAYRDTILAVREADMAIVMRRYLAVARQTRMTGSDHVKVVEDVEQMVNRLLNSGSMTTSVATGLLEWYQSLTTGDQRLAEPLIAGAVQAAVAQGIATSRPQELTQLVRFYYQLPLTDEKVDYAILKRAYDGGYHRLLLDAELHSLLRVFFEAGRNRRYHAEFGEKLLAMANEEPATLADLPVLRMLPCDAKATHALVQNLLERTAQEQMQPNTLSELTRMYHGGGEDARAVANALLQRCKPLSPQERRASREDTMEARIRQLLIFAKGANLAHLVDAYIARCFAEVLPTELLPEAFVDDLRAQRDAPDAPGTDQLKKALEGWSTRVLLKEQSDKPQDLPSPDFLGRLCHVVSVAGMTKAELKPAVRDYCSEILKRVYENNPKELPSAKFLDDLCQTVNDFGVEKRDLRPVLQAWCTRAMQEAQAENPTALPSNTLLQRLNGAMDACGMQASDLRDAMIAWYQGAAAAIQEAAPAALPGPLFIKDALNLANAFDISIKNIRESLQAWCERVVSLNMQQSDARPEGGFLSALKEVLAAGGLKSEPIKPIMLAWYARSEIGLGAQAVHAQMRQVALDYAIRPDEETTLANSQWVSHFLQEEYDALCKAVESQSSIDQLWRLQGDEHTQLFELLYRYRQMPLTQLDEKLTKRMDWDLRLTQTAYLSRMMDAAEAPHDGCYLNRLQQAFHLYIDANIGRLFGPSITLTHGDTANGRSTQTDEPAQEVSEKAAMLRQWNQWQKAHWQGVRSAEHITAVERACQECDFYDRLAHAGSDDQRKKQLADYLNAYAKYKRMQETDALLLAYGAMQLSALPTIDSSVPQLLVCVADGGKRLAIDWDRYLDGAFRQKVQWADIDVWQDEGNAYPVLAALLGWMQGPLGTLGATFRSYLDHAAFGRRAKRKAALRKHLRYVPEHSAGEFASNPMLEWLKDWNPIPKGESL